MYSIQNSFSDLFWSEVEYGWVSTHQGLEILTGSYQEIRDILILEGFSFANVVQAPGV